MAMTYQEWLLANRDGVYADYEQYLHGLAERAREANRELHDPDYTVVSVRITLSGVRREDALDKLQAALETIPELSSAYELVSDGFGRLTENDSPLA